MKNIDEAGVIIVKKYVSPLTYVGIIILALIFGFVTMIIVLSMMNRDSYKTAEMSYLSSMANAVSAQSKSDKQTAEFEVSLGLNPDFDLLGDYYGNINNTVFRGLMSVDGVDVDYVLDYFNGDKRVFGTFMHFQDNVMSFALPEISDTLFYVSGDEGSYNPGAKLDTTALSETLIKIADKYFDLVGEPDVIEKNYIINENGIYAECVHYRIEMDEVFLAELLNFSIDAITENSNLTDLLGDELMYYINELKSEVAGYEAGGSLSGESIIMDVYAQDNVVIKRDIKLISQSESASVSIIDVSNDNMGYLSVSAGSGDENIIFVNEYTKNGGKFNGKMTCSVNGVNDYIIGGDFLTVTYKDVVYDDIYGFIGTFQISIPTASLNISGSSMIDGDMQFAYDIEIAGQHLAGLSGYMKITEDYTEIDIPDMSGFEQVDINGINIYGAEAYGDIIEKFSNDAMDFFYYDFEENFADENGNYDILGTAVAVFLIPLMVTV